MIKKRLLLISMVLILAMVCGTAAIAAPRHSDHGASTARIAGPGHFGHSNSWTHHAPVASVYLFPQDMDPYSGMFRFNAWGLMSYRLWGKEFRFSFRGFNLDPRTSYALIYYPDPESGAELIRLGSARSDRRGRLKIRARMDICSLPNTTELNYFYGAQLMLVALDEEGMLLPPESEGNLISYHAIRFIDTDGCQVVDPETPTDETGDEGETPEDVEGETSGEEDGSNGETEEPSTPPDDYDNDPNFVYPF